VLPTAPNTLPTPPEDAAAAAASPAAAEPRPEPGKLAHWQMSLGLFVGWFVVDHATKFWAETRLAPTLTKAPEVITIIPGMFDLVYAQNTGAAFSIGEGRVGFLAIISLLASCGFTWFWYTLPAAEKWGRAATALILSGAVGNLIDRAFRGFVVDFIHVFWRDHHYPIFNIADSCICVGAAILIWRAWKGKL
jgi:signal peptidase II